MKGKALVQRPASTIQPLKAKKSCGTLLDEEVKRLVNIAAHWEPEVKAIPVDDKDGNREANYCSILASTSAALEKRRHIDRYDARGTAQGTELHATTRLTARNLVTKKDK